MVQGGHQTGVQVRNAAHLIFYFFARRDININMLSGYREKFCPGMFLELGAPNSNGQHFPYSPYDGALLRVMRTHGPSYRLHVCS